tara:strand:- start:46 stop:450 length:405 start_codon:yes stop_codon:yes gene_type:complete
MNQLKKCVIEGCNEQWTQEHHVIPSVFSEHDRKEPFNPITNPCLKLCDRHHNMVHRIEKENKYKHSEAIKRGQQRAKAEGKHIGRKTNVNDAVITAVYQLRQNNVPIKRIAKDLQIGVGTVYKLLEPKQYEMDI